MTVKRKKVDMTEMAPLPADQTQNWCALIAALEEQHNLQYGCRVRTLSDKKEGTYIGWQQRGETYVALVRMTNFATLEVPFTDLQRL